MSRHSKILMIFFGLYLLVLACLTIIPQFTWYNGGFHILTTYKSQINLVPFRCFYYIKVTLFKLKDPVYFIMNILGNIMIFIPLGFFSAYWMKKPRFYRVLGIGCGVSCLIEIIQLWLPRASDIDDVILNTLEASLGYVCFKIYQKIKKGDYGR